MITGNSMCTSKDGTNYLRYLTDDEFESLRKQNSMKMNIQRCGRRFSGGCDQREGELCVSAEFVPNLEEEACGGIQNAKDMSIKTCES